MKIVAVLSFLVGSTMFAHAQDTICHNIRNGEFHCRAVTLRELARDSGMPDENYDFFAQRGESVLRLAIQMHYNAQIEKTGRIVKQKALPPPAEDTGVVVIRGGVVGR